MFGGGAPSFREVPGLPVKKEERQSKTTRGSNMNVRHTLICFFFLYMQLYVRLTPVVMIFVLSAAVLISFSKMACESKEPPVETVNDTETEAEWSKVTYFAVAFSLNSELGYADNVVYSVPQAADHASSPLYSTVIYRRQYLQRCQCRMCTE
ncbi:hypothetical protein D5F01_LYC07893 [Larimichthys crocea]|uniref:Uncharacterized protein n=1 Tax=Larimichthys crocea TaxID=215358 RepID=A0A6G0IMZ7_LARCR|nr:hypothetical protein D5F01_LYC07893 [Larimichthys crocea]